MTPEERREALAEMTHKITDDWLRVTEPVAARVELWIEALQARIDTALALHPRVLTDKGYLPEPVWFCTADHQRWPCANVWALTGEGT